MRNTDDPMAAYRRIARTREGHLLYEIAPEYLARGSADVFQILLGDDALEEVMFNGPSRPLMVYERSHGMCVVNAVLDEGFCWSFAQQVAAENNRVLDAAHPILDGALRDGSRINVTIPPVAHGGLSFTIRKFRRAQITAADLVRHGTMSPEVGGFLWTCIDGFGRRAANMLIVGGTGSGKTTTLGALSMLIPTQDRLVLIEDTPEVQLAQTNAVRLVAQPGSGMDDLLRGALRMRPDRILVGEVRGPEARTLFEAMNTGHEGCAGTLHANSARESINRITSSPMAVPLSQTVGLDLIVVQERISDAQGPRRVLVEIAELAGYGENVARMNVLYAWDQSRRELVPTGVPSRLRTTICRAAGIAASDFHAAVARRGQMLAGLASRGVDRATFLARIAGG